MRSASPQSSFASGEISPLLYARTDYQRYQSGLRTCRGWLPLRQGGVTRAPGTLHRGRVAGDNQGRLIAFSFAEDDSIVLELTPFLMRFWRYGSLIRDAAGDVVSVVTPWTYAALRRLKWVQSADVIWFCDGAAPVQRLARFSLTDWRLTAAEFTRGPFRAENLSATAIRASAASGAITLTATGNVFDPRHVGALWQLRAVDQVTIPLWTGNTVCAPGTRMIYDGRVYEVVTGTDTGPNPPVHRTGEVLSATGFALWRFISDDVGIVKITRVLGPREAEASVVKTVPAACVAAATTAWAEGAWSERRGYPGAIAIHDQRLVLAATSQEPRTIWFSTLGLFTDFEPGIEADSSFAYTVAGAESQNRILWLASGARALHVGALGEEYSTRSSSQSEAIGPTTAAFRLDSTIGSADIRPLVPDGTPIFVARDRQRLFELRYAFEADAQQATELSLPAEHIGSRGMAELAWSSAPMRIGWIRLADGTLAAMMLDRAEEVLGWAVVPLAGGRVEAIAVSPDATGTSDVVTLLVRRAVNGRIERHVEELAPIHPVLSAGAPITQACHLYSAVALSLPGGATMLSGLDHLEGGLVQVWSDAGWIADLRVEVGQVALPYPVNSALVGLADGTDAVATLDLYGAVADGNSLGRQKRLKSIGARLHRTAGLEVRVVETRGDGSELAGQWTNALTRTVASAGDQPFSGTVDLPIPSGHAREVRIEMRARGPAPATLLAVTPIMETADA